MRSPRALLSLLLALASSWQFAFHCYDAASDAGRAQPAFALDGGLGWGLPDDDDAIPPLLSAALPGSQEELKSSLSQAAALPAAETPRMAAALLPPPVSSPDRREFPPPKARLTAGPLRLALPPPALA